MVDDHPRLRTVGALPIFTDRKLNILFLISQVESI